eukprot:TRINITY_DN3218_c0_g2_i3.p1 TRINITY_DN3218_c0_g2~~TRINITY_DN3218_c0_g2_i3.p1  ORF type:complete len:604 (+),score=83.66 TRINITY_DN3218_c0_g2_i3:45-1856(+)
MSQFYYGQSSPYYTHRAMGSYTRPAGIPPAFPTAANTAPSPTANMGPTTPYKQPSLYNSYITSASPRPHSMFLNTQRFSASPRPGLPYSPYEVRTPIQPASPAPYVKKLGVVYPGKTPDQPGDNNKIIGKYRMIRTIGEGAFGKVKLAVDMQTGVEYAVKAYSRKKLNPLDLQRVYREVDALKKLFHHNNIIKLYDFFEMGDMLYLVMELARGGDLLDYTDEKGSLDNDEARQIFMQVAEGLYYCHQYQIIHRDMKLENILLTNNDRIVKISDFGLSNSAPSDLLRTICGTPVYRAPEMIRDQMYTYSADVWSMGVILYAMLHGKFPFYNDNINVLNGKILSGNYVVPNKGDPLAHDLIRKMLTVNPKDRISMRNILRHPWLNPPIPVQLNIPAVTEAERDRKEEQPVAPEPLAVELAIPVSVPVTPPRPVAQDEVSQSIVIIPSSKSPSSRAHRNLNQSDDSKSSLFRVSFGKKIKSYRKREADFRQREESLRGSPVPSLNGSSGSLPLSPQITRVTALSGLIQSPPLMQNAGLRDDSFGSALNHSVSTYIEDDDDEVDVASTSFSDHSSSSIYGGIGTVLPTSPIGNILPITPERPKSSHA